MSKENISNALSPLVVDISTLHEDPDNARSHDEKNIQAIKASLSAFGQQKPIVVDSNGCVLAGNGTLVAAKLLGWKRIAASKTDIASEDAKRAYALADNRTAELATWDFGVLSETLRSLSEHEELIAATGFDADYLAGLTSEPVDPDYSVLDEDMESMLDDMRAGVKKAILVEFELEHYEDAKALVKYWRERGAYVGMMLVEKLRESKDREMPNERS